MIQMNLSGGTSDKEPGCQCRRHKRRGFEPWVRKIPWRRKWHPTPALLPGKPHGQRSLAGYSPWGLKRVRYDLATKQTSHILDAIALTLLSVLTMWHSVLNSCGLKSSQTDVCPLQSALIPLCNPHLCDQTKAQCLHTPASHCETHSRDSQSQNGIASPLCSPYP